MRPALLITVPLIAALPWGCAAAPGPHVGLQVVTPVLLFDTQPGWPTAAEMALRSSWPAAPAYIAGGEVIWFRERFLDVQSGGWGSGRPNDHVYRRFDTYRVGRSTR